MRRRPPPGSHLYVLVGIVACAAIVRFVGLGSQSLWLDEYATVGHVRLSPVKMLEQLRDGGEITPPLYYLVLKAWVKVLGTDDAAVRSLSAVAGTLTVPLVYDAARTLSRSIRVGLVAAALVAFHPMLIWYSQEARSYGLLVFLCALSFALFARSLRDPTRGIMLAWGAASALALATHYFAFFLIAAEGAWLLYALRDHRGDIVRAGGIVAAISAGLLVWFLPQRGRASWLEGLPLGERLEDIAPHLSIGLVPWGDLLWLVAAVLVCAAVLLAFLRAEGAERQAAAIAGFLAAVVIGMPLLALALGSDYLFTRNLLPVLLPLLVAAAAGFGARRAGMAGLVGAAALCALWLTVVVAAPAEPERQKPDLGAVADSLGAPAGDRLVLHGGWDRALPLLQYLPGYLLTGEKVARAQEIDVLGFEHQPDRSACWSGVACNFPDQSVERVQIPSAFRPAGQHRVDFFTVERFRAGAPRRVNLERLTAREPGRDLAPLFQPAG